MDIKVLDDNPLYKDQTYRLKFTFSSKYPIGEWSCRHSPTWSYILLITQIDSHIMRFLSLTVL